MFEGGLTDRSLIVNAQSTVFKGRSYYGELTGRFLMLTLSVSGHSEECKSGHSEDELIRPIRIDITLKGFKDNLRQLWVALSSRFHSVFDSSRFHPVFDSSGFHPVFDSSRFHPVFESSGFHSRILKKAKDTSIILGSTQSLIALGSTQSLIALGSTQSLTALGSTQSLTALGSTQGFQRKNLS